jgi:nicotinamidase-related amidase
MIRYNNMLIPTSIEEVIDPSFSAVLAIDFQSDLTQPRHPEDNLYPGAVKNTARFLNEARKRKVKVVYTQAFNSPDPYSAANWYMSMRVRAQKDPRKVVRKVIPGTKGAEILGEVKPKKGDIVISKPRNSAFFGTGLDLMLRNMGIKTVILTGCQTDGCIESTLRDALFCLDYFTVVVEDCVASFARENHEAMMKVFKLRCDVLSSEDIVQVWAKKK